MGGGNVVMSGEAKIPINKDHRCVAVQVCDATQLIR